MPRARTSHKNVRKLTKMGSGRSYGITIPIGMVRSLGWRAHQRLELRMNGQKIQIADYKN